MIFNRPVQKKQSDTLVRSLARSRVTATPDEEEEKPKSVIDYFSDYYGNGGNPTTPVNPQDDLIMETGGDTGVIADEIGTIDTELKPLPPTPERIQNQDEKYLDDLYKEYIAGLKSRSTEGKEALKGELDQSANEALLTQEARAGAAGLGLSGAAQSIQGGLTAQLARQRALGLDEYDRNSRKEMIGGISEYGGYLNDKRETQMSEADRIIYRDFLEKEAGEDLDGDGDIGGAEAEGFVSREDKDEAEATAEDERLAEEQRKAALLQQIKDENERLPPTENVPTEDPVTQDERFDISRTGAQASKLAQQPVEEFHPDSLYLGSDETYDYYIKQNRAGHRYKVRRI